MPLFILSLSRFCSIIVNRLLFLKQPLEIVILSTDIFLIVSTKHLMMLLNEKEDSKDSIYMGKIRYRKLIHFTREMVLFVEDKIKRELLIHL